MRSAALRRMDRARSALMAAVDVYRDRWREHQLWQAGIAGANPVSDKADADMREAIMRCAVKLGIETVLAGIAAAGGEECCK